MSKTVSTVLGLASLAVPAGTVAGDFRFSLIDALGVVVGTLDSADTSASFPGVVAGTYTVSAARLDSAGVVIGGAVSSDPFTVADDAAPVTVNVDVPASVAVTLS